MITPKGAIAMKEIVIGPNDGGQRLDKFLLKSLPALPPALMHKYIRLKRIKRNGKRAQAGDKLETGDVLSLYLNDELLERPAADQAFRRLRPNLRVVYEDDQILLCDKRPGMVVHEDDEGATDTLINHIKAYLFQKGQWDPDQEQSFAPALCNRIDRYTGGIVMAAKTAEALRVLNEKIRLRQVQKYYLCLVHGLPSPKEATISDRLLKDSEKNAVRVVRGAAAQDKNARQAVMRYKVLQSRGGLSLLECQLFTGRTHQIRVQLASRGWPLAGDAKYGVNARNRALGMDHQALYSYQLRFDFQGEPTCLDYLNGRTFRVEDVPFLSVFYNLPKE